MEEPIPPHAGLSSSLGRQVRAARKARGLSIRSAAALLNCSPRFVHQLELGKPTARIDKVQQALNGLGMRLSVQSGAEAQSGTSARLEARAKQAAYEARLARAHDRIAAALALGQVSARDIARARAQVARWAEHRICSGWYVARWGRILEGTRREIAARLLALEKEDAGALFQNTPFGFLVRDYLRA